MNINKPLLLTLLSSVFISGCFSSLIKEDERATGIYQGSCEDYDLRLTLNDDGLNKVNGVLEWRPKSEAVIASCGGIFVSGKNHYNLTGNNPLSLHSGSVIYYRFLPSSTLIENDDSEFGLRLEGRQGPRIYKGTTNKGIDKYGNCKNFVLERETTKIPKEAALVYREKC